MGKKKAIIVECYFMTRVIIDVNNENLAEVVRLTKHRFEEKVRNELSENMGEWYDDVEMPYGSLPNEDTLFLIETYERQIKHIQNEVAGCTDVDAILEFQIEIKILNRVIRDLKETLN